MGYTSFCNISLRNSDLRTWRQSLEDNQHIVAANDQICAKSIAGRTDGQNNSRYGHKARSDKGGWNKVNLIQTLFYNKDRKKRKTRTNCVSPAATTKRSDDKTSSQGGRAAEDEAVVMVITWATQPCPVHARSGRGCRVRRRWTCSNRYRWCPEKDRNKAATEYHIIYSILPSTPSAKILWSPSDEQFAFFFYIKTAHIYTCELRRCMWLRSVAVYCVYKASQK